MCSTWDKLIVPSFPNPILRNSLSIMKALKVLLIGWLILTSLISSAQFTEPAHNPNILGANSRVYTTARSGNTLYIGGDFTFVGPNTGGGAQMSATTGQLAGTPLTIAGGFSTGHVHAVIPDGSGGWYIGGDFTTVGGTSVSRLAHILSNNTVDPLFSFGIDAGVQSMALVGNILYIGGSFTSVGGQTRILIASVNVATNQVTSWNPGANGVVETFSVAGNTLYVGGGFTTIAGQTRNRIASFDLSTTNITAWNPNASSTVRSIVASSSTVYAGGLFNTIGGQTRVRIAALDATTGLATSFNPSADGNVFGLALSGSTLYATGEFCFIGSAGRCYIAALNTSTGLATSWNPSPNGYVQSAVVTGGLVYALGNFTTIGGQQRSRLAALDPTTGVPNSLNLPANGLVMCLGVNGTSLYVGGQFTSLGGQIRNRIAALDATTGQLTNWNPNANSTVYNINVQGSTVYVCGDFATIGGQSRNKAAALDATTGLANSWSPNLNAFTRTISVNNGIIYVGGDFTQAGGQTRNRIAAFDETTGNLTSWDPNASGAVNAILPNGSDIYVGGAFSTIGGQTRNRLAALSPSTGLATTWNPNANNVINTLAISGSTLYAGGAFTNIGGQNRDRIAAVSLSTGLASSWAATANDVISSLAVSGTNLYAAGRFTNIGGQSRNRIAALDLTSAAISSWNPNANAALYAVSVSSSSVYLGGEFLSLSGKSFSYVAGLSEAPCTPPAGPTITPSGPTTFCTGGSVTLSGPAGLSYLWSNNATTQSINVTTAGSYTLRTIIGTCTSNVSVATIVTVNTPPAKPTITVGGRLIINSGMTSALSAPAGFSYIWSNNATTQTINAGVAGDYTVRTIANGCTSEVSDPVTLTVLPANSFVWNGTGNDVDANNWSNGALPNGSVDSIVVNSGTLTITGARTYNRISVRAGAIVNLNSQSLTINGIIRNEGTITGTGTLTTSGARIYGAGNIEISNFAYTNASLSIEQTIRVNSKLTTFGSTRIHPTLGRVFLTSNATTQAVITPTSSGTFTNPSRFIVERYISPRGTSGAWMFLGPPVKDYRVSGFGENNTLASQTYNNGVPALGSIFVYDPTDNVWPVNNGYVKPSGPNQSLGNDLGARVWISRTRMNMGPFYFRGAPILEPVNFALRYCDNNCSFASVNGFNLVKNPYAAWLDWDASTGWTKSNLNGQIHVWNSTMGQFASYVGGVSINQGSNLIAPGQAFFVEAISAGASMAVNMSATTTSNSTGVLRSGSVSNVLKLQLHSTEMLDEAAIRLESSATTGFDPQLDARKLAGSGPEITTSDIAGNKLAINSVPPTGQQIIPMTLSGATAGMEIKVEGLSSLDAGTVAYWHHPSFAQPIQVTDQPLVLTAQLLIGLTIQFRNTVTSLIRTETPALTLLPNPASSSVQLKLSHGDIKQVDVIDNLGRTLITSQYVQHENLDVSSLAKGTYVVRVLTSDGVSYKKLVKE